MSLIVTPGTKANFYRECSGKYQNVKFNLIFWRKIGKYHYKITKKKKNIVKLHILCPIHKIMLF